MTSDAQKDIALPTPTFEAKKFINAARPGASPAFTFRNYYSCPYDGTTWKDDWSCMCNDRCPACRTEVEPYDSEDI